MMSKDTESLFKNFPECQQFDPNWKIQQLYGKNTDSWNHTWTAFLNKNSGNAFPIAAAVVSGCLEAFMCNHW